jgi:hypothetical protein
MRAWRVAVVGSFAVLVVAGALIPVGRAWSASPPAHDRHPVGAPLALRSTADADWGAGSAGVSAAVHEIIRTRVDGMAVVVYRVTVSGFSAGQPIQVWMRRQSGVVQFLADDVTANLNGVLVSHTDSTQAFFVLAADYAAGEPFDLAIINADRTIRAFTRAVPFPA